MDLSVLIPSYNEETNLKYIIPEIIREVKSLGLDYQILIIDTIKPLDNTKDLCEKYCVNYINREFEDSYGSAVRTGIKFAEGSKILIMDSDGSHDPTYIRDLYKSSEKYDLVIGSRYVKEGNTENNFLLIFLSYIVNVFYGVFLKINVKDISNSFRVYKSSQLKTIDLECNNFDIVEEILIKLLIKYPEISIIELPITFKKRISGKSKRKLLIFALTYIITFLKLLKIKRNFHRKLF